MKASDILGAPFQTGAALRHRRFFHPSGVLAGGRLARVAPPGSGLPLESTDVVVRISKGLGTPGALPDFAGLAWRMPPSAFAATPWDVLLVSAGIGTSAVLSPIDRVALRPVTSWAQAPYSTLMPLRHDDRLWWVRALLRTSPGRGLSLARIRDALRGPGLEFEIEQACGGGQFTPLATLRVDRDLSDDADRRDPAFDPVRHTAPSVSIWPGWLRDLRASAYRGSRDGRDAQ